MVSSVSSLIPDPWLSQKAVMLEGSLTKLLKTPRAFRATATMQALWPETDGGILGAAAPSYSCRSRLMLAPFPPASPSSSSWCDFQRRARSTAVTLGLVAFIPKPRAGLLAVWPFCQERVILFKCPAANMGILRNKIWLRNMVKTSKLLFKLFGSF